MSPLPAALQQMSARKRLARMYPSSSKGLVCRREQAIFLVVAIRCILLHSQTKRRQFRRVEYYGLRLMEVPIFAVEVPLTPRAACRRDSRTVGSGGLRSSGSAEN